MQDQKQISNSSPPPKKKVKRDTSQSNNQNQSTNQIFCKCYSQHQINSIMNGISGFKNYTKYISILIRHQQKSIDTIPKHIREQKQFQQLNQRIQKCIQSARANNQFLSKIAQNYSQYLHTNLKLQNQASKQNDIPPNSIIHIFLQITKQWSQMSPQTKKPMKQVVQLVKKHSRYYNGKTDQNIESGPTIFVQNYGMGRILCQLQYHLQKPKPMYINGCQQRVLYYLCGQYFLQKYKSINKMNKKQTIYPFMHDFSNKYRTSDAYQAIQVPQWPYKPNLQTISSQDIIFTSLNKFQIDYMLSQFNNQWDILISYVSNDKIQNILKWIQISYKNLKQNGIWILALYSSFQMNVIPITYKQFRQIIEKSQFKVLQQKMIEQQIILDRSMTRQKLNMHYLVLQK